MSIKITLGKITHRTIRGKKSFIQLNKNIQLQTNSGSMVDRMIEPGSNTWYWFAMNEDNIIIDMQVAVNATDIVADMLSKHKNLVDATQQITDSFQQLTVDQRNYILQLGGFTVTAVWTIINGVQTVNALFAWEPVNFCIGAGMTAVTGIYSKLQYDNLTDRQRSALQSAKKFQAALTTFHATIKAYAPESMQSYDVASPAFKGLSHKVYKVLPKMDVESFETNVPNWSIA